MNFGLYYQNKKVHVFERVAFLIVTVNGMQCDQMLETKKYKLFQKLPKRPQHFKLENAYFQNRPKVTKF